MILQRLYGFIASITFFLFKIYHPFVVDKIKKAKIDELKKSIQIVEKSNEQNERLVNIFRSGLEKMERIPKSENAECKTSHENLIASTKQHVREAEARIITGNELMQNVREAIAKIENAKKIVVQPERNFWHYYFMIAQLRKRKFRKLVKLYSDFNRKFF
jgi:hypothetical protein